MSLQEPSDSKKPLPKKDKITGGVNLKKSIAKKSKPKDTDSNGELGLLHTTIMSVIFKPFQVSRQLHRLEVPLQTLQLSTVMVPKWKKFRKVS